MTVSPPDPPLTPDERVSTGSEREVLEGFLDLYRGIVLRKLTGVDDAAARRRLVPSPTTLAGIAKHLALVEREWFGGTLAGQSLPDGDSDDEWSLDPDDTIEGLLTDYEHACEQ